MNIELQTNANGFSVSTGCKYANTFKIKRQTNQVISSLNHICLYTNQARHFSMVRTPQRSKSALPYKRYAVFLYNLSSHRQALNCFRALWQVIKQQCILQLGQFHLQERGECNRYPPVAVSWWKLGVFQALVAKPTQTVIWQSSGFRRCQIHPFLFFSLPEKGSLNCHLN